MAEETTAAPARPALRLVRNTRITSREIAHLDLSRPGAVNTLNQVASDFLFELCGPDGRRRLLAQHGLLAAA